VPRLQLPVKRSLANVYFVWALPAAPSAAFALLPLEQTFPAAIMCFVCGLRALSSTRNVYY